MTIRNKTITADSIFAGDKVLWMVLFFLCIVSILEVYSASSNMSYSKDEAFWSPVLMHTVFLAMGVGVTWLVHRIPCRFFGWLVVLGPLISIVLLILVMFSGEVNSTSRWLKIFGISFQPSELAKGSLVIAVAWILSVKRNEKGATISAFKWILAISAIICGLIVPENLSTAVLTFMVVLMMMIVGKVPLKPLLRLVGSLTILGALGFCVLKFTPESALKKMETVPMMKRVVTWSHRVQNHTTTPEDPLCYDLSINPQITQSHIAVSTCNFIGRAPGNSRVRDFLPQAYSDFIFAIIIEEMGIEGAIIVLMLYITILFKAGRIASKCQKNFPAYLMMGLALLIVTQALINMAVAVGIFPVTGQPLPLVSRGGSSIMVNCAYIGMMLSISRTATQSDTPQEVEKTAE